MTSSTGIPYTLHVNLPPLPLPQPVPKVEPLSVEQPPEEQAPPSPSAEPDVSMTPKSSLGATASPEKNKPDQPDKDEEDRQRTATERAERLGSLAKALAGLYCPCPGFAYNSLAGDRHAFVSPFAIVASITCLTQAV